MIVYGYDCSTFGTEGNFQIFVEDSGGAPVDVAANAFGKSGAHSSAEYAMGNLHLTMNSECKWTVKAKQP